MNKTPSWEKSFFDDQDVWETEQIITAAGVYFNASLPNVLLSKWDDLSAEERAPYVERMRRCHGLSARQRPSAANVERQST